MVDVMENPRSVMKKYGDKQFDFGIALIMLKLGYRVYRKGWNGSGMWVCYQKGYPDGIAINKNTAEATGIQEGTVCQFLPYLMMKTASPTVQFVHWAPSNADVLAEDWMLFW